MVFGSASRVNTTATAVSLGRKRWLKWLCAAGLVCALLAVVAWQTRERWLVAMIHAWMVNDPVERADAVMVLGGGAQYRAFEAARMHREGLAGKVLFPSLKLGPAETNRVVSSETELIGRILEHERIPATA